jgi:alpha-glucosidase
VGVPQARVAAMLLLTLRGTPTMYYGDELGMANVSIPADRVQDPFEKNVRGVGLGRDPCRTPMQWDGSIYAGFTVGEPWLPISDDYAVVNVRAEGDDPSSFLALYRRLLKLRRSHPAISIGEYEPLAASGDLLAYVRHTPDERILIALNLGGKPCALFLGSPGMVGRTLVSTYLDRQDEVATTNLGLRANEGLIVALSAG